MARQKSVKIQKASYTERVLGAMTQIQKEHRKHAIHLATLRAQIRKNAESKKDKLGPQWVQWVGKAIQKLTEDGVIEHTNTQEIAFTSQGKNIITSVKKIVPDEGSLWRQVSSNISRGRKRRRSSIGVQDTPSVSASGSKRPKIRKTFGSAYSTPTRPRKSQTFVAFRDLSPLTDISDDDDDDHETETVRLKSQLQGKEGEIQELRNLLGALRQQQDSSPVRRYETPDSTRPVTTTPRVGKGITRTQSGSIIPDISKQPTPAPSESGDDEGGDAPLEPWVTPYSTRHHSTFPIEGQPSGSSPLQGSETDAVSTNDGQRVLVSRVEELERLLAEEQAAASDLRNQKADLEVEKTRLQDEIAAAGLALNEELGRVQETRLEVQARENDVALLKKTLLGFATDREDLREQLRQQQATNSVLTTQQNGTKRDAETLQAELNTILAKMNDLNAISVEKDGIISQTKTLLATAQQALEQSHDRTRQLKDSITTLQQEVDLGQRQSSDLRDRLNERENANAVLQIELARVKESNVNLTELLASSETRIAVVEAELEGAVKGVEEKEKALTRITENLRQAESANVQVQARLGVSETNLRSMQEELEVSRDTVKRLKEDFTANEEVIQGLSGQLADAEQRVVIAEELRLVSEKRDEAALQELNRMISTLDATSASDRTEIRDLHLKLGHAEMELKTTQSDLAKLEAEELRIRTELKSEKRRTQSLQVEKLEAEHTVKSLEGKVVELNTNVGKASNTVESLKALVDGFRRSQIRSLDDLTQEVASLGVTAPSTVHMTSSQQKDERQMVSI